MFSSDFFTQLLQLITVGLRTIFKKRPNGARKWVICFVAIFCLSKGIDSGAGGPSYMFYTLQYKILYDGLGVGRCERSEICNTRSAIEQFNGFSNHVRKRIFTEHVLVRLQNIQLKKRAGKNARNMFTIIVKEFKYSVQRGALIDVT